MNNKFSLLPAARKECLLTLLDLHKRANSGHIGASLSCLDMLIFLYFYKMNDNDWCILSKGHAVTALYTVLAQSGRMPLSLLDTYYQDGTLLGAHPPCCPERPKAIPFGTGSLGHGLSLACGTALSMRYSKKKFNVYCVLSDGDCNEGSTWEAALFAAHQRLSTLTILIDRNRLQGFGQSDDVLCLEPLVDKWKAFGFDVHVAHDGHSFDDLDKACRVLEERRTDKPRCIIAQTTKGKNISFMENRMEWHYLPLSEEQYQTARKELQQTYA